MRPNRDGRLAGEPATEAAFRQDVCNIDNFLRSDEPIFARRRPDLSNCAGL